MPNIFSRWLFLAVPSFTSRGLYFGGTRYVGRRITNRWTGATGSEFRIKRDPAKLFGSAVARSTQPLGVDLMPMSEQIHLTQEQAYLAMFEFLTRYFAQTNSDDVGSLLGSMSLTDDGSPADAAYWSDWLASVAAVKRAESSPQGYRSADFKLEKQ